MNNDLFLIHSLVVAAVSNAKKRSIMQEIDWNSRAICIAGARGTGKTTLLLQHYLAKYKSPEKCLYVSGDNIHVIAAGLFQIAKDYFAFGGEALIVDEVHKYPNWSQEIKNIYDTYAKKTLLISGSSTLDLTKARYDLSRRVVYHRLAGLSFREYLYFAHDIEIAPYRLDDIVTQHQNIAASLLKHGPMLKYFQEYLTFGYYPYFLEGIRDYHNKLLGAIEKVLFEDIAVSYNLPQPKLPILKKLLWLIATSHPFVINIEGIASDLGVARQTIIGYIEILETAGLLRAVRADGGGSKLVRKPGKLYFDNSNLIYAITGSIKSEAELGTIRETFFASQLAPKHKLTLHHKADFMVDDTYIFEVGGPSKKTKQIAGNELAYLAVANIEVGSPKQIPLYLFGLLS
jgi:predicted AAA+ superfamily ATPase